MFVSSIGRIGKSSADAEFHAAIMMMTLGAVFRRSTGNAAPARRGCRGTVIAVIIGRAGMKRSSRSARRSGRHEAIGGRRFGDARRRTARNLGRRWNRARRTNSPTRGGGRGGRSGRRLRRGGRRRRQAGRGVFVGRGGKLVGAGAPRDFWRDAARVALMVIVTMMMMMMGPRPFFGFGRGSFFDGRGLFERPIDHGNSRWRQSRRSAGGRSRGRRRRRRRWNAETDVAISRREGRREISPRAGVGR